MASVAKWLRQWIVIPPLGGSSPLVRPSSCIEIDHPSLKSHDFWVRLLQTKTPHQQQPPNPAVTLGGVINIVVDDCGAHYLRGTAFTSTVSELEVDPTPATSASETTCSSRDLRRWDSIWETSATSSVKITPSSIHPMMGMKSGAISIGLKR